MSVGEEKRLALMKRMMDLDVQEADLVEKFVLGSGKGGQKVNKTSSCVYLKHLKTGIEVKCQHDRSRELNRFLARRELCDKIEEHYSPGTSKKAMKIEKAKKQKKRRARRSGQGGASNKDE